MRAIRDPARSIRMCGELDTPCIRDVQFFGRGFFPRSVVLSRLCLFARVSVSMGPVIPAAVPARKRNVISETPICISPILAAAVKNT